MTIVTPNLSPDRVVTDPAAYKLAILGLSGGSHIGASLARSAAKLGIRSISFDASKAFAGPRLLRSLSWHLGDRRPLQLKRFSKQLVKTCARMKPEILVATGAAPVSAWALSALQQVGVVTVNYSTDDPWNPAMRSNWHLQALPLYDVVFSARRSNLDDLRRLGCKRVHYLPFGYDESLYASTIKPVDAHSHDILFVGGADNDRAAFLSEFMQCGARVTVVGGYWERYPAFRPLTLGIKSPETVRSLTAAAKVNLCLVRRANRDGHVMRSFEIAAIGGCMLAEDTEEHREIFGPGGEAVVYFSDAKEAAKRAQALLRDPFERKRLAVSLHRRIAGGAHTYAHRLATMLGIAVAERARLADEVGPGEAAQ